MIYYGTEDIAGIVGSIAPRLSGKFVFTLPPKTPLLMTMWRLGKLFPRGDRSPVMVPHSSRGVAQALRAAGLPGHLREVERVTSGFYISTALCYEEARA